MFELGFQPFPDVLDLNNDHGFRVPQIDAIVCDDETVLTKSAIREPKIWSRHEFKRRLMRGRPIVESLLRCRLQRPQKSCALALSTDESRSEPVIRVTGGWLRRAAKTGRFMPDVY
jgi:hypothetical protein